MKKLFSTSFQFQESRQRHCGRNVYSQSQTTIAVHKKHFQLSAHCSSKRTFHSSLVKARLQCRLESLKFEILNFNFHKKARSLPEHTCLQHIQLILLCCKFQCFHQRQCLVHILVEVHFHLHTTSNVCS